MRAGRSIGTAIVTGYRKGLTAIIDANIVTFLVAFILFILATAGVQGFAFTLGLGVIVSLFTAVLATQAILYSLRGTRLIRSKAALGAGEQRIKFRFDYMGKAKWFFSMSGMHPARLRAGDRRQGHQLRHRLRRRHAHHRAAGAGRPRVDQVRNALAPLGLADAKIQTLQNPELGKNVVQISTKELGPGGVDAVDEALEADVRAAPTSPNDEAIGPSFGKTVAQLGDLRDHRLAAGHLDLHRAALRVEVRRAGADRADARHPDRGRRLRPRRPGGDDVDGRGAPDHPGLLALRHDHRVRPRPREHPAHAERGVLADRQPLAVRGHRRARWRRASARCCRCSR